MIDLILSVLDVDLKARGSACRLARCVLGTVPIVASLNPLGNGGEVERAVFQVDLRDRPFGKGLGPHRSTWFRSHRHTWTLQPFQVSQEHAVKVLRLPRNPAPNLRSRRLLHKRARANLARGRSFSSVAACSGSGLTGARERSKPHKKACLPRNPAAKPTRNLVATALLQVASQACACQFSARAQLLERRRTQRLGSHMTT